LRGKIRKKKLKKNGQPSLTPAPWGSGHCPRKNWWSLVKIKRVFEYVDIDHEGNSGSKIFVNVGSQRGVIEGQNHL